MKVLFTVAIITGVGFISGLMAQNTAPDSLYNIGNNLYRDAKYGQAADLFEKAAKGFLEESDSLKWANAILRQGDALMNRGEVRKGRDLFLFVNENHPKNADATLKAYLNRNLGRVYRELEQYELSKDYYLKGIEFAEASGDSTLIATLNNNLSYPYLYSGDYEQAFSHQKKAKEIYESTGEDYRLSFVLNGMFMTLRELGLHAQANKYIRQSTAIREYIGNPSMLDIAYHNMALSFNDLGKQDSSIIYYHKSLELTRQLGNPYEITQTLINIGQLYERSGDYENALAYYNEALESNYQTERPVSIANNLMQLADIAKKNEDYQNAENFYLQAFDQLKSTKAPTVISSLNGDFGNLKTMMGEYEEALDYLKKADSIAVSGDYIKEQIRSKTNLANYYRIIGETEEAVRFYEKAFNSAQNSTVNNQITTAVNLARAFYQIGSGKAFDLADQVIKMIAESRTNVAGFEFKSGFFSEYAGFFKEVASWHIELKNDPHKAFELIEAAKARVLMDEMAEAEQKFLENLDESVQIKLQQYSKQIDALYNELLTIPEGVTHNELKKDIRDLEFRYQSYLNEIRAGNPTWSNFEYPEPLDIASVQALLDKNTAVLEYAFSDDALTTICITKDKVFASVIDSVGKQSARDFILERTESFRRGIQEKASKDDLKDLSAELYFLLMESVLTLPPNFDQLIIIPDGPISFLPIEALQDENGYLIENFNVKHLPSVSIYPFIQNPNRTTSRDLLAVAGSGFIDADGPIRTGSQTSFASLPSTLLEVDAIAKNFVSPNIMKNEDVTESSFKSHDLSNYRFIHLATHGSVDEVNPSRSGLMLSKKTEVESLFGEDGFLNSREISRLNLNADLVVLSACDTGVGKYISGEGLLGLQRSFLIAGASSVVVSLWSVYDRSTSELMADFYSNMVRLEKEEVTLWNQTLSWIGLYEQPVFDYKSKALHQAKLKMLDHPYFNHPVHWAPFVMIGK